MTMRRHVESRATGMTLIEMLAVIAIIGILAGLLLPTLSGVRERGRMAFCQNNLRNIGQGLLLYSQEHDDYLPPVSSGPDIWDTEIMQYVGYETNLFLCPSDPYKGGTTNGSPRTYAANGGVDYGSGDYPFGLYNGTPLRMGDLDYNDGDIFLIGERPGDSAASRGYVGDGSFCGLDQIPGVVHKRGEGGNYLLGSMAVRYMTAEFAMLSGTNNFWGLHTP